MNHFDRQPLQIVEPLRNGGYASYLLTAEEKFAVDRMNAANNNAGTDGKTNAMALVEERNSGKHHDGAIAAASLPRLILLKKAPKFEEKKTTEEEKQL